MAFQTIKEGVVETPTIKSSSSSLTSINVTYSSLPSKGLTYPVGGEISYRPFTFGEIKRASAKDSYLPREVLKSILEGVECSFNIKDLTLYDVIFIGLMRKIATLGQNQVFVPWDCPSCSKANKASADMSELDFIDIDQDLPLEVDIKNSTYQFMPLPVGKFLQLIGEKSDWDSDESDMLAAQCSSHDFETTKKMMNELDSREDMAVMGKLAEILYHGLRPLVVKCDCGYSDEIKLEAGDTILLPFRGHEDAIRNRIRTGPKTAHKSNSCKSNGLSGNKVSP